MLVKKYSNADKKIWDEFVSRAKNKHFFFFRDFMEYHSDRFNDHSLMFFDDSQKLLAILPANHAGDKLYSHQGLTFGGIIIKSSAKQKEINAIFDVIPEYLKKNSFSSLIYKKTPYIYHLFPCDEDLYSLFRLNSNVVRRDVSSTIKMNNQIKYSKGRKWIVKKSKSYGVVYQESDDLLAFWSNLTDVLMVGHGAKPVHSYDEIVALKNKFPENIKMFSASCDGEQVAGAVIFITDTVAHTQYLYNTVTGRDIGALDGLVDHLVNTVFVDKEYFDFGISNEQQGRYLNVGLISQKEGFGARAVVHDFYEIKAND
ncbi:GNAT family N-acetyltransferase [Aeromonas veronii]|uniref:GNAT family N-acetyltransferase n=1 Tax=Aeromonas veronii TaxID=654 RepID=UPI00301DA1D1